MIRSLALIVIAVGVSSCGFFGNITQLLQYSRAAEAEIEKSIGMRPAIGFNWNNGRLTSVNAQFPDLYDAKPLREVARITSETITTQFKQKPNAVVLSFVVKETGLPKIADTAPVRHRD